MKSTPTHPLHGEFQRLNALTERADFTSTLLDMSRQSVINIEGRPGTGKSSFIAEMLKVENQKGTPVAHLELRGRDLKNIPEGCSVSNYICYQLGLESAVDSGKIYLDLPIQHVLSRFFFILFMLDVRRRIVPSIQSNCTDNNRTTPNQSNNSLTSYPFTKALGQ
jgi:hypothetical protein